MKKDFLILTSLMFAGCVEEPEAICVPNSGDTELKFGAAVIAAGSGDEIDFYFDEVGTSFLYIDGECRWWGARGLSEMSETRTGVLSQAQAERISEEVQYREWKTWNGETWDNVSTSHYGTAAFYRPGSHFKCNGNCDLMNSVSSIRDELWDGAESMTGGIWAWADDEGSPVEIAKLAGGRMVYDWPFSVTYDELMDEVQTVDEGDRHPAYLETDPDALVALRAIRLEHDRETDGHFLFFAINDSQAIAVHIRDALPIENDLGFIEELW
ncbi:MAG: hypothetical protein R6X02_21200 [Enhygromyxa sp.]